MWTDLKARGYMGMKAKSELRARESAFYCDFFTDSLCDIKGVNFLASSLAKQ